MEQRRGQNLQTFRFRSFRKSERSRPDRIFAQLHTLLQTERKHSGKGGMAANNSGSKNRNVLDRKPARKKKDSTGKGKLQMKKSGESKQKDRKITAFLTKYGDLWLRERDLNPRPPGYEPDELPNCSIPRYQCPKALL